MQNLKFKTKLDRSGFEDRCEYFIRYRSIKNDDYEKIFYNLDSKRRK